MFLEHLKRDEKNESYGISGEIESANIETPKFKNVDKRTSDKSEKILDFEAFKVQKVDQNDTPSSQKVVRSNSVVPEETNLVENVNVEKVIREETGIVPKRLISSMIKCNDCIREIVREKLYDALSKVFYEADEQIRDEVNTCNPVQVAISVESALFEKWGRSTGTHKHKYRCLLFNIKDPENPDFRRKVLLGHVQPETLRINMTANEMLSDTWQRWNQYLDKERALSYERRKVVDLSQFKSDYKMSGAYKCGRCGHQKMYYKRLSVDGLTKHHITCPNCNQYWESTNLISGLLPI